MEEIKNKLSEGYDLIQKLNIKPTKGNMEILLFVMSAMQEAYRFIDGHFKPEEPQEEKPVDNFADVEEPRT